MEGRCMDCKGKKKSLHLKVCGEQNKVYLQLAITITTRALILLQPLKITI